MPLGIIIEKGRLCRQNYGKEEPEKQAGPGSRIRQENRLRDKKRQNNQRKANRQVREDIRKKRRRQEK